MTDATQRLREAIASERVRLRADIPIDRAAAIRSVVQAIDRRTGRGPVVVDPVPDLVSGRLLAGYGGKLAVQFCLEAPEIAPVGPEAPAATGLATWAELFLVECDELETGESVLGHVESGFMRLADRGDGWLVAWRATRLAPAAWRERAHIDWWASQLTRTAVDGPATHVSRHRSVSDPVESMMYQLAYPPDAVIDGCSVRTYCAVLRHLIDRTVLGDDPPDAEGVWAEAELISSIAKALDLEADVAARAVAAFTVDRASAAWHATVPGVAAAPLVRMAPDRLIPSRSGLTTEPLFFLGRELRRRAGQDYHNSAWLREVAFRDDLQRVFSDRRFVTSTGRIELRRGKGDIRTDIDAVVFDRKTGTLGLFELKSQDPFSRSAEEMERRRDNVLYANRQVSGVLDWVNRNSADEVLRRMDDRTAKTFRVQKVYPFVLARYMARFDDGPAADRRAAWGTWPEVLHAVDATAGRVPGANPIAAVFARLRSESIPAPSVPPDARREVRVGQLRVTVYGSRDAMRTHDGDQPDA